jgi:hypothetical protein
MYLTFCESNEKERNEKKAKKLNLLDGGRQGNPWNKVSTHRESSSNLSLLSFVLLSSLLE